jgi:transposase
VAEKRDRYDREFREGAVRIVEETGKPIAQIARDLGINEGTLGNWAARARETAPVRRPLHPDPRLLDEPRRRLFSLIERQASAAAPSPR